MEKIYFVLNILGCWVILYFNKKNEKRLFMIQSVLNGLALACFLASVILKFI